jgi:hypothetical protein
MAIVNDLIDDFIYQHKILPNSFFIYDSTVVSEHFHHSVDDIMHKTWGYVVLGGGDKVNSKFLGEHVIQAIDVLRIK